MSTSKKSWRFWRSVETARRKGISTTGGVIAFSLLVLTGLVFYVIYVATPFFNAFNLWMADSFIQASNLTLMLSYVLTALEYFLGWYGFKRLVGWASNRMGRHATFLLASWGDSDLTYEYATITRSQVKALDVWLHRLTGWKVSSPALATVDWKHLSESMSLFRNYRLQLRAGRHVVGGGRWIPEMLKATNWVNELTRSVRVPFNTKMGIVEKFSIGGSHGQTGACTSTQSQLLATLGIGVPVYFIMSTSAVLNQPTKAENLTKLQEFLVNNVDAPLFDERALKVIYDFATEPEGRVVDKEAAALANALSLHFSRPVSGGRDDMVNLQANITSKCVIAYDFGPVSSNPGELGLEIPRLMASLKEKASLHAKGIGTYFHAPPEVVTPDFAKSLAFVFLNPDDGSARARKEALDTALQQVGRGSSLRMNVTATWHETPRLIGLITLDWAQLNMVFWCRGLPEGVLRKLTGPGARPSPAPAPIGERVA